MNDPTEGAHAHHRGAHDARGHGRKLLHHPRRGPLNFDYATFQANDDPALKLATYTLVA